jgi:hypothetical protein
MKPDRIIRIFSKVVQVILRAYQIYEVMMLEACEGCTSGCRRFTQSTLYSILEGNLTTGYRFVARDTESNEPIIALSLQVSLWISTEYKNMGISKLES